MRKRGKGRESVGAFTSLLLLWIDGALDLLREPGRSRCSDAPEQPLAITGTSSTSSTSTGNTAEDTDAAAAAAA